MKKMIILSGVSNSGKTATLKQTIWKFINSYGLKDSNLDELGNVSYQDIEESFHKNNYDEHKDWVVIFNNVGVEKKRIGFNTAGDDRGQFKKSIDLIQYCDIVICASKAEKRSNTGVVAFVQEYITSEYSKIEFIPIYKILYRGINKENDDDIVSQFIINQLNNFIK